MADDGLSAIERRLRAKARIVPEDDHRGVVNGWCIRCHRPITMVWGGTGALGLCYVGACRSAAVGGLENSSWEPFA